MSRILTILFSSVVFGLAAQEDFEVLLDSGYSLYLDENYQGAIEWFDRAEDTNPENAEVYYLRGVCYSHLGDKRRAMDDLHEATDLKPEYAAAYYEKGYLYLTDQNPRLAIREFDRVIQLNPDYAEAYVSRGTARCMLEDREGAQDDWKTAKKLGIGYSAYMTCE